MALKVNEIFYSIQGESSYAGYPCVFVRMTGCNLRCSYCDTRYAYEKGEDLEIFEILDQVRTYGCPLVEVTGGEPLIQRETPALIQGLLDAGFKVLMETNGSLDIGYVDPRCIRIVDVKCPSSGEVERNDLDNLRRLAQRDEVKFILNDRGDYEYARGILRLMNRTHVRVGHVHFSPVYGKLAPTLLARWILDDCLKVRLNLQIHKIIWDPERRGV
ncbi:MAG TPA: 7-carboxy-7-deazaguanine synthase [Syntrophobacteraceae bacterium]|nr:7-carboxy-7-deazaguanine synthase [Syntrophobacteraceae bacterium]